MAYPPPNPYQAMGAQSNVMGFPPAFPMQALPIASLQPPRGRPQLLPAAQQANSDPMAQMGVNGVPQITAGVANPSPYGQVGDVLNQFVANKQQQSQQQNFAQQILAMRFQPNQQDRLDADYQNNMALLAPNSFKGTTAMEQAGNRASLDLLPYTTAAKFQENSFQSSGGIQGALVNRLMAERAANGNPISYENALYQVQTGMRQGLMRDEHGNIVALPGVAAAKGAIKYGETAGGQQAELQYAAPIAGAKQVGEATGKAQAAIDVKSIKAPQIESLLQQAEKLLPNATAGGMATGMRDAAGYFGEATPGSKIDSRLDIIGAALTSGVPRMEGPQSNYDVALYQQAAGDLANTKKPAATRLAAIKTLREINNKYAHANQDDGGVLTPPPDGAVLPNVGASPVATHRYNPATGQIEAIQ